jgi:iron complex outermembrane recepter protein
LDTQRAPLSRRQEVFAARPHPLVLALSIAYAGVFLAMPAYAQAQTATGAAVVDYAIVPGSLEQTLLSIGRLSGRAIVFDPALVRGHTAAAVEGRLGVEEAVRKALAGSGLELSGGADGVLTVKAANAVAAPTVAAPVASSESVTQLKAIQVVAERDQAETSFKVDRTSTSTRSNTDLMDLPSSVTVVTAKVLESQQATSVEDAIANVAGVIYTASPQGSPSYSIRGYGQTSALNNGLTNSAAPQSNIYGVERIEVLKGPQAILSGQGSLGGAVNIVSKKPQAETIRDITLQYGSYGDKTVAGDFSGALTADKKLTYRLVAAGELQNNNWAGYEGNKTEYIMPELRWKDDKTDATIGYSTDNRRTAPTAYTFAYKGYVQQAPNGVLGDDSDGFGVHTQNYFYTVEQKLSDNVSFNSKMQFTTFELSLRMHSPLGLTGTDTMYYAGTHQESRTETTAGDHYLESKFSTGAVRHKLTTGISHDSTNYYQEQFQDNSVQVPIYADTSLFTPVGGYPYSTFSQKGSQFGAYVIDLMSWNKFNLLVGGRRSKYESGSDLTYLTGSKKEYATPSKGMWETTPMVGLVYNVTPNVSAYASYAEGFNPQLGYSICGGAQSQPMRTRNKEVGMKFDLLDSKFSVTTSAFDLDQLNTLQYNSSGACYNLMSAQRTKGVEVDMAGELTKGLNLLVNATYSTIEDVSGYYQEYAARPKKKASIWATYDFQSQLLHGWGVGVGLSAWDSSLLGYRYSTTTTDPVKLAGAARTDASVSYHRKDWSVILGVKNVFDRQLYEFATTDVYVPMQPGRTATLTYKLSL